MVILKQVRLVNWYAFNHNTFPIGRFTLIMGRNGHNSTGSIICQHEVTDVKRNFLAVYRIDTGNTL